MEVIYDTQNVKTVGAKAFRFMPADERRITGFNGKQLYMSDPKRFNDLLDVNLPIENLTYRGPFENHTKQAARALIDDNEELLQHWFYDRELITEL